jgi:hypothetical protein
VAVSRFERGQSVYQRMPRIEAWEDASETCANIGYHLFWPETAQENEDVRRGLSVWDDAIWLGVKSVGTRWCWYDGRSGDCDTLSGTLYGLPALTGNPPTWVVVAARFDTDWDQQLLALGLQYTYICEAESD